MRRRYAVYTRWYEGDRLEGRCWTRRGAMRLASIVHNLVNYVDIPVESPDGVRDYWWKEPRINAN